ncbi:hypothetical protein [Phenylobacterium kunshanense]|uniref:Uncharacterized protein n=1 Tax=Phenylobacterium kunshanense TaxID=1445034 RepID=A0A328BSL2_9CAUL|nr:hypothetical protein [Phenylobacterium kunshanense]RAK68834.1 hypothetical protein DJ019_02125 [Phenylobacterium kunshanense]
MVIPFGLSWATRRLDAQVMATMLLIGWCFGRIMGVFLSPPQSMQLYPLIDLCFGVFAFLSWRRDPRLWKLGLVGLLLAQSAGHAAFWLAYGDTLPPREAYAVIIRYMVANNAIFAAQLLLVAWAGGVDDLARGLLSLLSRVFRMGRNVGAPQ